MKKSGIYGYANSHKIFGIAPKEVLIDSFVGRTQSRMLSSFSRPGDIIHFPNEYEIEAFIYTKPVSANEFIEERLILVHLERNGKTTLSYFNVGTLYKEVHDSINNIVLKTSFSDCLSSYDSDEGIVKALYGHSLKCIQGPSYQVYAKNRETGQLDTSKIYDLHLNDYLLLDPPLNPKKWYKSDSSPIVSVTETCKLMHKLFGDAINAKDTGIRQYLALHHGLSDEMGIYLFYDNAIVNDDGFLILPIAVKNQNGEFTVYRDSTMSIYPNLLLEKSFENGALVGIPGIHTMSSLREFLHENNKLMLEIVDIWTEQPGHRFFPARIKDEDIVDDIGALSFFHESFGSVSRTAQLPTALSRIKYQIVGMKHYAPYSKKKNQYCILYAQLNNPYDSNAIEIKRWFPTKLSSIEDAHEDGLYSWGFISRQENFELHRFMTEHSSRVLFGKTDGDGLISVLGGFEVFENGAPLSGFAIPMNLIIYF